MRRNRLVRRTVDRWRHVVAATRPIDPETAAALEQRWHGLPEHVRTPAQTLGQHAVGCEGTHGVFPRCNLACTPCYHSRDANRVRVDGRHTLDQVRAQLRLLRRPRGPRAHAQLIGDERCNRTTYGFYVGERYFPILDDEDPADLHTRDAFFRYLGGVDFAGTPLPVLLVKLARVIARHPSVAVTFTGWLARMLGKVGIGRLLRHHRIRPVTFVMHSFMDAADVTPAWQALQAGTTSSEPRILAAQQRLQACSYAMAHPETGQLVPACVQHSVLDPAENATLRQVLPLLPTVRARAKS